MTTPTHTETTGFPFRLAISSVFFEVINSVTVYTQE